MEIESPARPAKAYSTSLDRFISGPHTWQGGKQSPIGSSCLIFGCMTFPQRTDDSLPSPFGPSHSQHCFRYYDVGWLLAPVRPRRPFRRKARSPQVRTVAFPAQPPDLHRLSLGRESFAAHCPLALLGSALSSGSYSSAREFAPRCFQRSPRGRRLAVRLGRYDQLPGGLSPPSHHPCWDRDRGRRQVTAGPLPHHRTYGSVYGGSRS